MFCPNCGEQNNKKQNFCRYCGLHLKEIERAVANQLVFGVETKRLKQLRAVRRTTDTAQFLASAVFLAGILSSLFYDPQLGRTLIAVAVLSFFLAQAVRYVTGYLQRRSERDNVRAKHESDTKFGKGLQAPDTKPLLEDKPFERAQSVVEHTTQQLQTEGRQRK